MPLTTLRKTPGVYIEEIALFPPSVAPVETAIPAFIGYTEKAKKGDQDLTNVPTRITSLLEFEQYFGNAKVENLVFDVSVNVDGEPKKISSVNVYKVDVPTIVYNLYYAMQMFFANGGGPCYIVSVGDFSKNIERAPLKKGLDETGKIDEVTIIVMPDAIGLSSYTDLINLSLKQCKNLQDRVAIIDIPSNDSEFDGKVVDDFRGKIAGGLEEWKYGAVYFPYLETSLVLNYNLESVNIRYYAENASTLLLKFNLDKSKLETAKKIEQFLIDLQLLVDAATNQSDITKVLDTAYENNTPSELAELLNASPFDLKAVKDKVKEMKDSASGNKKTAQEEFDKSSKALNDSKPEENLKLSNLKADKNLAYNAVIQKIEEVGRITLPPSSTVAGIYADVDRTRGVWKAPANVSLNFVVRPIVKITDDIQDGLNVHPEGGKSINAIRSFTGRGTLVWGARTLAGNDNEWRYISVRRFFNFVEESVKKASARFVFEPNSKNTWVKVKAMIENFLIVQWRAGALVGDKPEHAFYVKVGLNETMTAQDILEGYMVVEIGMAVVRPAEFIILQFSHKMQES